MRALLVACVILGLLPGCTEPRSATCREICKREAECVEELGSKIVFDENECVAACAALEQDAANSAAKVARHAECVRRQTSCAAVLECK
jgi:hypothetical protein